MDCASHLLISGRKLISNVLSFDKIALILFLIIKISVKFEERKYIRFHINTRESFI